MLTYKNVNITQTTCDVIVHGCNAQGKMGSGVALAIKKRFPKAYEEYRRKYDSEGLELGTNVIVEEDGYLIVNSITQEFYGYDKKQYVSYSAISKCFKHLNIYLSRNGYSNSSIAMPRIGCGLGGGDWSVVSNLIETELNNYTVEICDWP